MEDENQHQHQQQYACNGNGGGWCCTCKTAPRVLKFVCSPFRAFCRVPWLTWKDVLIMVSGVALVMGIVAYTAYLTLLDPPKSLPENLKFLLSGIVGYVFAYVPASKAVANAELNRNAALSSDARFIQVVGLLQQQKEIYESRIERLMQDIEGMEQEDNSNGD